MNQTRPAGRKPAAGTTMSRWRASHRSRSGPPRKGAVAVRTALGAASLPRPVPSRFRPAPQGCPDRCAPRSAMARTRRPAWCDASLACFGRSAPQRCGAPQQRVPGNRSASRATGRLGVVSRCRGPASPPVVPRGSPRSPGAAMPSGSPVGESRRSLPSCTAPFHGPDGLARPALTGTPHVRRIRSWVRMHVTHGPPRGSARAASVGFGRRSP